MCTCGGAESDRGEPAGRAPPRRFQVPSQLAHETAGAESVDVPGREPNVAEHFITVLTERWRSALHAGGSRAHLDYWGRTTERTEQRVFVLDQEVVRLDLGVVPEFIDKANGATGNVAGIEVGDPLVVGALWNLASQRATSSAPLAEGGGVGTGS